MILDLTASATSTDPAPTASMTWALTTVRTESPTDSTEPSVVTITINNTIPIIPDDNVTPPSSSNSGAIEIPTSYYTSSDVATSTLPVDTELESRTSAESRRSTVIGVSVGVPIGLVGIALLLYVLRRYLKYRESCTATVYFPPDPIDPFATRIFPKIELDALPNAIHELDGITAPSELENSKSAVTDPKRPLSIVSELEGSPVILPGPTSRASVATALNENRWSNVSSLAPPPAHQSSRAILSIVSQQHHGSGQDVFLTPPRPHGSHRLFRLTSGLLPEIEVADDETHSTPKSSTTTANKQGNSYIHESNESEQAVADRGTHESEKDAMSETARTSGEMPHGREAADEDEVSRKSGTKVQSGEVMHAGKITSEVEAAHKCEDVQQSDANERAAEDMQPGEG